MRRKLLLILIATIALSTQACAGYVELDVTFFTEMDLEQEVSADAVAEQAAEGGAVEFLHRVDVDLSESSDQLSSQVDEVILDEVNYRVPENTMTGDLHGITLLVGPLASLSPDDERVVELGTIPQVPAGTTIETTALPMLPAGEAALKEHLMSAQFTLFVRGYAAIDNPETPPIGKSLIEVDAKGELHKR